MASRVHLPSPRDPRAPLARGRTHKFPWHEEDWPQLLRFDTLAADALGGLDADALRALVRTDDPGAEAARHVSALCRERCAQQLAFDHGARSRLLAGVQLPAAA